MRRYRSAWSSALLVAAIVTGFAARARAQGAPPPQPPPVSTVAQPMPPSPQPVQPPPPGEPFGQPPGQPFGPPPPAQPPSPTATPPDSKLPGTTESGLPITRKGHVALEVSALELDTSGGFGGGGTFVAGTALDASAKIKGGLYATARFATAALAAPGNLMPGAQYINTLSPGMWLITGLSLGIPLAQNNGQLLVYGFSNAVWNLPEYLSNYEPLRFDLGFEMVSGMLGFRVDVQPYVIFPFDQPGAKVQLFLQHAAEIQYGHTMGAGFRLQGVANTLSSDAYQAAVEPFVFVRRDLGFVRLGLLKTLDENQGSLYKDAWGARMSAGFHLE